ncbi:MULTISPECIES: glycosyltransferase family 25 protein [unclassified Treponema]|uniref:glycosyltransferase family 25 protein n=1 Tax=unclassified Treponema TaxID=2638727 RepID=UPI0020A36788|nr:MULTISPECIES: glycosyltransferase family 25 protein [unclassified Treponema]
MLNLEHNIERKKYMQELLKDLPIDYEFFPAVYGRNIKNIDEIYNSQLSQKITKRQLSLGEIGCALSHKAIYKKMIDEDISQALILEDDIAILPNFFEVYTAISQINVGNKVVLLGTTAKKPMKKLWKKKLFNNYSMYLVLNSYGGTYGYVIGLDAAKKIYYSNEKVFTVADNWKYYRRFSQIWLISPSIVGVNEVFTSEIGDDLRHSKST